MPSFKAAGATFVAQQETARIMEKVQPKEMARRIDGFKKRGLDPNEVKLILADVTFDNEMTIRLGGREVQLMYFGPGQQAGDTFVLFPHARTLFTPGAFGKRSMPNMAFTTSVENWIKLLDQVAEHGCRQDPAGPRRRGGARRRQGARRHAGRRIRDGETGASTRVVSVDEAIKTLTFPQYKDWRNYRRLSGEIKAMYELIQTGKRSYFD